MKFSKLTIVILLLFVSSLLFCKSFFKKQNKDNLMDISSYKTYIGVSGSTISSYGITYSFKMNKRTDLKFVSFFYYNEDKDSDYDYTNKIINIGMEYHHILHMTKLSKLFLFLAGGYSYSDIDDMEERITSVGVGLGLDYLVVKNFFWEFGLGYNFRRGENSSTFMPGIIIGCSYAF